MKRALTALLTVALACPHAVVSAQRVAPQSPAAPCSSDRNSPTPGQQITVEFTDGRQSTGIVADVSETGVWIEHPPQDPSFVLFRDVQRIRDAATGAVVAMPHPKTNTPKWVPTLLVTVAVVAGIYVVTHGIFPGCLVERCQ